MYRTPRALVGGGLLAHHHCRRRAPRAAVSKVTMETGRTAPARPRCRGRRVASDRVRLATSSWRCVQAMSPASWRPDSRSHAHDQWMATTSPGSTSSTKPTPSRHASTRLGARRPRTSRPSRTPAAPRRRGGGRRPARGRGPSGSGRRPSPRAPRRSSPSAGGRPAGRRRSTWKAWTGTAAETDACRPASASPPFRARGRKRVVERLARDGRAGRRRSRSLPSQYASTTRRSSGSGRPFGRGDELEVRPGALEAASELAERSLVVAARRLAEQLGDRVGAAVAEPVRPERVAGEQDGPGHRLVDHGRPAVTASGAGR